MIVNASRKSKFSVKLIKSEDISDFKSWWPRIYKRNCLSIESVGRGVPREQKQNFQITNFTHFKYSSDQHGVLEALEFIDGITSHTFRLGTSNNVTLPQPLQNPAYPQRVVPINSKKN